jgi:hypothetical protein
VPLPAFWVELARCETGGRWTMRGRTYSGGLGFANTTWTAWAAHVPRARGYVNAADAPPAIQIQVGEYGLAHGGYWGCIANHRL